MLKSNALISVEYLLSFLQSSKADFPADFFRIYNSSGDATSCTVEVTETGIRLIVVGGANASDNTLNFADADKDTISELITAITGLSKGWVCNRITRGEQGSAELYVIPATGCKGSADEQTLIGFDALYFEDLINSASQKISTFCKRNFLSQAYVNEYYNGDGGRDLFLKQYPVTALTRVANYDPYTDSEYEYTENTDFIVEDAEGGILHRKSGWNKGTKNFRVSYTAGYTADNLPDDLKTACAMLCGRKFTQKGTDGVKSLRISDYAVTFSEQDISPEVDEILSNYRNMSV